MCNKEPVLITAVVNACRKTGRQTGRQTDRQVGWRQEEEEEESVKRRVPWERTLQGALSLRSYALCYSLG